MSAGDFIRDSKHTIKHKRANCSANFNIAQAPDRSRACTVLGSSPRLFLVTPVLAIVASAPPKGLSYWRSGIAKHQGPPFSNASASRSDCSNSMISCSKTLCASTPGIRYSTNRAQIRACGKRKLEDYPQVTKRGVPTRGWSIRFHLLA